MRTFWRRVTPGLAVAGTAVALVGGFDRALHSSSPTASAGGSTGATESGPADTGSTGGGSTGGCADAVEYTGDQVVTQWGPVQVVATVGSDGTVCAADAVVFPTGDPRSSQINAYAVPIINDEVASQGVSFDAVSGATVTSEGYRQSLQSILDQL